MSHSHRRWPILPMTAADSEKADKRIAQRKLRRAVHVCIAVYTVDLPDYWGDDVGPALPLLREVSNRACFDKDGRQWVKDQTYFWRIWNK